MRQAEHRIACSAETSHEMGASYDFFAHCAPNGTTRNWLRLPTTMRTPLEPIVEKNLALPTDTNNPILTIADHHDAVTDHHKHAPRCFGNETWTFEHLAAFVMRVPVEQTPNTLTELDVVVLFSNHCFSREIEAGEVVDESLIVMDGNIQRVLDPKRYALSRQYLPQLVKELETRHIRIADESRPNFVTIELHRTNEDVAPQHYAMFFEVKKDRFRKRRMLLRVQSAYVLENPSRRQLDAKKMRFHIILKRAHTS